MLACAKLTTADRFIRPKTPNITKKATTKSSLSKITNNLEGKRQCQLCISLHYTNKFLITSNQAKITNRAILHCKQTHNQYIIRCFICNTWDLHQKFISPHELLENLRIQGYSIHLREHIHPRSPADVKVFPAWSVHRVYIKCSLCRFQQSSKIDRMPETIEQELNLAVETLQSAIFGPKTNLELKCTTCYACVRNNNDLLRSPNNLHAKCPKFNCVTEGAIYALQCSECQKIYVGQTGRIPKTRIQEQLRDIKNVKENSSVSKNFHTHASKNRNFEVFILAFCKTKFEKLIKEDIWISILGSSYPTGMNQHSDGHYNTSHIVKFCFMHFQHDRRCTPLFETILL